MKEERGKENEIGPRVARGEGARHVSPCLWYLFGPTRKGGRKEKARREEGGGGGGGRRRKKFTAGH